MPRIQEYTIADLKQLLNSRTWFAADPLPITRQRALSHVHNPRADPADVALLVAYEEDRVVAYLWILPDQAFVKQRRYKIGWMTAWWANPDRKFAGLGAMLLMRAGKFYSDGLGAGGFSADSKRVFAALKKFRTLCEQRGLTGFASLGLAERLPRKWLPSAPFRGMLQACDGAIDLTGLWRQRVWQRRHPIPADVHLEYIGEFDEEAEEYLVRYQGQELTKRGRRELNWILRYPWVLPAPLSKSVPYYFSSMVKAYSSYNIKVYDRRGCLVALMMLIAINGHLIVPYCYHDDQAKLCALIIGHHISLLRLKAFTTYRADLLEALSAWQFPWVWRVPRNRAWVMAGTCAKDGLDGYAVQDGDGDLAWTL